MLAFSDMPYGTKLQSVRQLASELGIAPMTVSQVYQQLRDEGLIEMRAGLGAFTARDPLAVAASGQPINALRGDIEAILAKAEALGVSSMALVSMINAGAQMRRPATGLNIVFVCIFEGPGRDYVDEIRPTLASNDQIELVTLDSIRNDGPQRQACLAADIVLTFSHREAEVRALVEGSDVLGLRFIPSQRTRQSLAGLDLAPALLPLPTSRNISRSCARACASSPRIFPTSASPGRPPMISARSSKHPTQWSTPRAPITWPSSCGRASSVSNIATRPIPAPSTPFWLRGLPISGAPRVVS